MIKSMTGYGKAEAMIDGRKYAVEIRSLNHRYLEISLRLPGSLSALETEIKRRIMRISFFICYRSTLRTHRWAGA